MKRYLCTLTIFGMAALPDWASAYQPCWGPPPPCIAYGPPILYPPPLAYVQPWVPVYEVPLARVYTVPMTPRIDAVPSLVGTSPASLTPAPRSSQVAPTAPLVVPIAPSAGVALPPTPHRDVKAEGADPTFRPAAAISPSGDLPRPTSVVDPAATIPRPPAATLVTNPPPMQIPTVGQPPEKEPKVGMPLVPAAIPMPAPAHADALPTIPPSAPLLPIPPDPMSASGRADQLPPLVLPPEGSAGPSGVIPSTTARSSPLTAGLKVQVFIASGSVPVVGARRVGFFNHSTRDLDLVIEGRAVKLPQKMYLHAEVPSTFRWNHSDGPSGTTTIPDDALGLDVLFRE